MKKSLFTFLAFVFFFSFNTSASHVYGGELTYRCVGNGQYVFTVTFYKDCSGIPYTGTALNIDHNITGLSQIVCNRIGNPIDISSECVLIPGGPSKINCNGNPNGSQSGFRGSISKFTFESNPINFSGIPAPAMGQPYLFYVSNLPCCRNSNNNTSCNSTPEWRCFMYRYEDTQSGLAIPPALLCDKSPVFSNLPHALQVINSSDTISISNQAIDSDLDSLVYVIDVPWQQLNSPCNYSGPYTLTNPMPGIIFPAANTPIDPSSGEIKLTPSNLGNWLICIRVESWRCGQKIGEVYRDFQIINIAPPINYPTNQKSPKISLNLKKGIPIGPNEYALWVKDTLIFEATATDVVGFSIDNVSLNFESILLSQNASKTMPNACPFPPCSFIEEVISRNDPTKLRGTITNDSVFGFNSSMGGVRADFIFPSDSSNFLPRTCKTNQKFQVTVKAFDDQCPVNGRALEMLTINLWDLPTIPAPPNIALNGIPGFVAGKDKIQLDWTNNFDSTTIALGDTSAAQSLARQIQSFKNNTIYRIDTANGTARQIAVLTNPATTSFVDSTITSLTGTYYEYYIETTSGLRNYKSESQHVIHNTVGIKEKYIEAFEVEIFPNPFEKTTSLLIKEATIELVEIYDLKGKLLETISNVQAEKPYQLGKKLDSGVYLVSIKSKSGNVVRRIVKLK